MKLLDFSNRFVWAPGENWNMMKFLTTHVSLPLGPGGPRNREQMARNSVKWVNIKWTFSQLTFPYPSVRVFLGIEIVALRVASRHTNATTILFAILCSVSPRHLKWQLFCNDQFLSQRETRLTEGRMLCAFATWRITNGTSWFFKPICTSTWGKIGIWWTFSLPSFPYPSV